MTRSLIRLLPAMLMACLVITGSLQAAIPPPALGSADQPLELSWVDAENGSVLFTLSDIVRFDWDRQIMELSPEAATRVMALPVVQYRDFAVKDREGVIYRGRFYRTTATTETGYDGTTVLVDQGPLKKLPASPFYRINGGYPTGGGAHDRDRFAERLHLLLTNAGVIKPIIDEEMPVTRWWSGHIWVGGEQSLKASAVLFPETFRIGRDAYIHLLLYKGQQQGHQFDRLSVYAICTSQDRAFTSRQEILSIAPPLLDSGIYVCKFKPWETVILPVMNDNTHVPQIASGTPPRYPKDAANENREGSSVIRVDVAADGKVSKTAVITSSGSDDLDKSALRAVEQYLFTPVKVGGVASEGALNIRFTFAKRKVTQSILPPSPVRRVAAPGPMTLNFEIVLQKLEKGTLVTAGAWQLSTTKPITLLPELPVATP